MGQIPKMVPRAQITQPAIKSAWFLGCRKTKKASIICEINNMVQIQARR